MPTAPGDRQDRALLAVLLGLHLALLVALPVAALSVAGFLRRTGFGGGEKGVILSLFAALALLAEIGLLVRALRVLARLRGARVARERPAAPSGPPAASGADPAENGAERPVD